MINKLYKSDTAWVMLSTLLRMGSGILLLPLIIRNFSKEDLGFWYVMGAASGMAILVDFGFGATTLRSVASLRAGAVRLLKNGQISGNAEPNWQGLVSLYEANKRIYRWLCGLIIIFYLCAIYFGLGQALQLITVNHFVALSIAMVGCVFIVLDANLSAFLSGLGEVVQANKIITLSQCVFLVLAIVGLSCGGGLEYLAAANLVNAMLRYSLTRKRLKLIIGGYEPSHDAQWQWRGLFPVLWPNTWRYGIMSIGAYLIVSANTLIISRSLGLAEVSSYGLTNQVIGVIAAVSAVFLNAKLPYIILFGVKEDNFNIRRLFFRTYGLGIFSFFIGSLIIIFWGNFILIKLGSKTMLLGHAPLAFFLFYRALEFNHSQFAALVISRNHMPFLWPAILSGLAIFAGCNFAAPIYGIWGILIVTSVVQLMCNNWYPVLLGIKSLNVDYCFHYNESKD